MARSEQDGVVLIPEIDGERVVVDKAVEANNRRMPHGVQSKRGGSSEKNKIWMATRRNKFRYIPKRIGKSTQSRNESRRDRLRKQLLEIKGQGDRMG